LAFTLDAATGDQLIFQGNVVLLPLSRSVDPLGTLFSQRKWKLWAIFLIADWPKIWGHT